MHQIDTPLGIARHAGSTTCRSGSSPQARTPKRVRLLGVEISSASGRLGLLALGRECADLADGVCLSDGAAQIGEPSRRDDPEGELLGASDELRAAPPATRFKRAL